MDCACSMHGKAVVRKRIKLDLNRDRILSCGQDSFGSGWGISAGWLGSYKLVAYPAERCVCGHHWSRSGLRLARCLLTEYQTNKQRHASSACSPQDFPRFYCNYSGGGVILLVLLVQAQIVII
jgi:hypothetical protein